MGVVVAVLALAVLGALAYVTIARLYRSWREAGRFFRR